jgi:SAM-dependent methyltransferase
MNTPAEGTRAAAAAPAAASLEVQKARQHAAWACGDYTAIGTTLQITGEQLCETMDLRAGSRVLDVAAGNGNASLAAARRHCDVVSTDFVQALLDRGRERAAAERLPIEFRAADAEALPFPDGSFDAVVSVFGAMFTPDQDRAARELCRVCRSGGRIGLANWTPDGFIGEVFRTIGAFVPRPAGLRSPLEWGTRARIGELFAGADAAIDVRERAFVFRYRSAAHWLEVFRHLYGPLVKAYAALDPRGQADLTAALLATVSRFDRAQDGTMAVPSDYLEVVVTRR